MQKNPYICSLNSLRRRLRGPDRRLTAHCATHGNVIDLTRYADYQPTDTETKTTHLEHIQLWLNKKMFSKK